MTDAPDFIHAFDPATTNATGWTLLLLHGTGGDEHSLLRIGRSLAPGANLLSPRGKVLEGTQARFCARIAEGVLDRDDVIFRSAELAAFVTHAATIYTFDPARVLVFGYSNGANIAASLLLLQPETLAGAVLMRPLVPLIPDRPPDLRGVPVLIAAGRYDKLVTLDQAEVLTRMLRDYGADVTLRIEEAGHKMTPPELRDVAAWLEDVFGN